MWFPDRGLQNWLVCWDSRHRRLQIAWTLRVGRQCCCPRSKGLSRRAWGLKSECRDPGSPSTFWALYLAVSEFSVHGNCLILAFIHRWDCSFQGWDNAVTRAGLGGPMFYLRLYKMTLHLCSFFSLSAKGIWLYFLFQLPPGSRILWLWGFPCWLSAEQIFNIFRTVRPA